MRYAAYFVPRSETALGQLGTAWMDGLGGKIDDALLASPRHYLFHATLKPPFRLRAGSTLNELIAATRNVAIGHAPIMLKSLILVSFGPYLVLASVDDPSAINALAFDCVTALDRHRAPLTDDERRRRTGGRRLTDNQAEMLDRWGYPFVGREFRFHMTLAGPVRERDHARVEALARDYFGEALSRTHVVDEIAITLETSEREPMTVVERIALTGSGSEAAE